MWQRQWQVQEKEVSGKTHDSDLQEVEPLLPAVYAGFRAAITHEECERHGRNVKEERDGTRPLFLFRVAPMALALFMSDDGAESRVYRWQQWLDFLQVGIVSFSAYLFFLYLPLPLPHSNAALDQLFVQVTFWRGFLLVVGFALRATLTDSRLVKSLFGRMTVFLAIFTVCEGTFNYLQIWHHLPNGTWYELLWTIPRTLMIWLAASWKEQEDPKLDLKKGPMESLLLAQFAHIAFPLLVLGMATRAIGHQFKL